MFEDLIEKLKTSIEELKKKLPGNGGDDDEYEDEDDDYEETYHGDEDDDDGKTVKVQITDLLNEGSKEKTQKIKPGDDEDDDEYEDDEDEDEEDADQKAAKKKKMLTYGAVVLIAVLVGWDYIFPPEPEAPAPIKRPKKRVRKKRKFPKKKIAEKVEAEAPKKIEAPKEEPKVVDVPPETAVGVPPKVEEIKEPVTIEEPGKPQELPVAETPVDEATPEVVVEKKAEPIIEDISLKMGENSTDPLRDESSIEPKLNIEEKIEKKLEYVSPPNYERSGRGLIYNCVGKHWACVDKFSYLTCRENATWSKQNNKKSECIIKNVYASGEDCSAIQKHYIETSESVKFCDGVGSAASDDDLDTSSESDDELKLLE